MSELWGSILRGIGQLLAWIFAIVPSWGVAIILLTVIIRVLLIPLTIKQIRSMSAMQKLQPELKKLQAKYKGDRQKMNEEVMKLYKEHGVNPLGGCFPMLAQAPVFIALYSVLRASIVMTASVSLAAGATPPTFTSEELKSVFCHPVTTPTGTGPVDISCFNGNGKETKLTVTEVQILRDKKFAEEAIPPPSWMTTCRPTEGWIANTSEPQVQCFSALGTGHVPSDTGLFDAITEDRSNFAGMHLQCSATQASSEKAMRQCTANGTGGWPAAFPYYALIALFVFTTYFQSKQMAVRAEGQAAQQQQMMTRILPVFLGFISLSIPMGVNVYWLTSNIWTIGQQSVLLKKQMIGQPSGSSPPPPPKGGKKKPPEAEEKKGKK